MDGIIRKCQTHLTTFCDRVTHIVTPGRRVDVKYLNVSKAFDIVAHDIS